MFETMREAFDIDGYDQLEVYGEEEETVQCGVSKNRIDSVESTRSKGIGVRALVDNTVGFAHTTHPKRVKKAAKRAVKLARLSQFELMSFPVTDEFPEVEGVFDQDVAETDADDLVAETGDTLERFDAFFSNGQVARTVGSSYIMNSSGIEQRQESTYFSAFMNVNKGNRSKYWFDASRNVFDVSDVAERAIGILEKYDNPVRVEKNSYNVVLTPYAQYQVFRGLLYPAFDADRVQRGKSRYAGKKGEQVAPETLALTDDGLRQGGLYTRPFDREGVPRQETPLIADGELQNFLYDVQRAEKERVKSTGNASGGYSQMPYIEPTNLVLEGDRDDAPEEAVIIHEVSGVHTANKTSGDFSLNITTGFRRVNGQKQGIEGGLFVGNVFELLHDHSHFYGEPRTIDSLTTRKAVFRDQKVVN